MQKCLMSLWAVAFGLVVVSGWSLADDKEKPKHSIKDVMKTAMKGGLWKKVGDGQASDAEKKELLALFESLGKNKPPKGEEKSWKEKTEALVNAAKAVVDDCLHGASPNDWVPGFGCPWCRPSRKRPS